MIVSEIKALIETNSSEKINLILSNLIDKSNKINKELNVLGLLMLILILVYFLGQAKINSQVSIGPIFINNLNELLFMLPLILSFTVVRYQIISGHKAEIDHLIKIISKEYFNNSNIDFYKTNILSRLILPVSMSKEISKFDIAPNGKFIVKLCFLFLIFPIICIAMAPYYFIIDWTYSQIINFESLEIYNKISIILTIWMIVLSIFYLVSTIRFVIKRERLNKEVKPTN